MPFTCALLFLFLSLVNPPADIPPPTVHLLVKELKEVKSWYMFGVALDIPVSQLDAIQSSNPHSEVERWLVKMLDYWLKSNTDASWKEIVQALEDTEQHVLAARVKLKYLSPPAPAPAPAPVGKRGVLYNIILVSRSQTLIPTGKGLVHCKSRTRFC